MHKCLVSYIVYLFDADFFDRSGPVTDAWHMVFSLSLTRKPAYLLISCMLCHYKLLVELLVFPKRNFIALSLFLSFRKSYNRVVYDDIIIKIYASFLELMVKNTSVCVKV